MSSSLPRWDLSPFFPSVDSDAFKSAHAAAVAAVADLKRLFDEHGIADRPAQALVDADVAAYEAATAALDDIQLRTRVLRAYVMGLVTTDSRDQTAQAAASALRGDLVPLSDLGTRYTAWLGSLDIDALMVRSAVARENAYPLRMAKLVAGHLMTPGEESLATELSLSGTSAWARLHGDLTSQLAVPLDGDRQPMSVIRALATDPDRDLRRRAYVAELDAWREAALPLAAAMNGIKHETNVLSRRRGWGDPLDAACTFNAIDRPTLDAMMASAQRSFPMFRRYLRAKARLVSGDERLPWYDLFAPVGDEGEGWGWEIGTQFVATHFDAYSKRMGDFARKTFAEKWIDAEPRPGKRDGAYCMGVQPGVSRILQNYRPSFDGVSTLAHELGHAYHNLCLENRTPTQSGTPMTLAETASIFCETIVKNAALAVVEAPAARLAILEASLQGACQVVVDIASRFQFEQAVLARRKERELSVDELCALMTEAQQATYGDGLSNELHPFMWAVKGHYYGATYYNFPYMFGLLFGLGLYARYEVDPDAFREGYDDLLASTGLDDAFTLGSRFGLDIRSEEFWDASLGVLGNDIARFEELATQS
ncbi:MAG: M3 family oligoendopeptidase [Armatimonadota bacterium]